GFSVSLGIDYLFNTDTGTIDTNNPGQNNPDPVPEQGYVVQLNNILSSEFDSDNIARFELFCNATETVYPNLLASSIVNLDNSNDWNVSNYIMDSVDYSLIFNSFLFSQEEVGQIHNQFLASLSETEEAEEPEWPTDVQGSIPYFLSYAVLFTNGSGYSFVWIQIENIDIVMINDVFDYVVYQENAKYISPLSAFDEFISLLQQLYSLKIDS
ncbi:MAG: hypothetical protein OEZ01_12535, partial [Candidatus Heimdallarchaeota archaeon]|nr:hypothetical protein [Candidatus Heimdallarchaeota archaeon]